MTRTTSVDLGVGEECAVCDERFCFCDSRQDDGNWTGPMGEVPVQVPVKSESIEAEGAHKRDKNKSRVELVNPSFIEEIGEVLAHGAEKYDEHDWRGGLKWSRIIGSSMRHLLAFIRGEDIDPESGLSHLAHLATNVMFLMEYAHTHKELDDRYGK